LSAVVFHCAFNWIHDLERTAESVVMAISMIVAMAAVSERLDARARGVAADSVEAQAMLAF
jgi:hypothetical protein